MIRHVIIIDDDSGKASDIVQTLERIIPDAEVYLGLNVTLGLCQVHKHRQDISADPSTWLVVTDMQMPWSADTCEIDLEAGYSVLDEMHRLRLNCPAVIVSSSEVDAVNAKACYEYYIGNIKYNSSVDVQHPLKELLRSVL